VFVLSVRNERVFCKRGWSNRSAVRGGVSSTSKRTVYYEVVQMHHGKQQLFGG